MQSLRRGRRGSDVYVPLRIRLKPAQTRAHRKRYLKTSLPDTTRLVLIGDRFWFLPLPKRSNPRLRSQLVGIALGFVLINGLITADVLLFRLA